MKKQHNEIIELIDIQLAKREISTLDRKNLTKAKKLLSSDNNLDWEKAFKLLELVIRETPILAHNYHLIIDWLHDIVKKLIDLFKT